MSIISFKKILSAVASDVCTGESLRRSVLAFERPSHGDAGVIQYATGCIIREVTLFMNQFRGTPANHFELPDHIERLGKLAYNLWWTWRPDAQRLFKWIDDYLWEETYHNPVHIPAPGAPH